MSRTPPPLSPTASCNWQSCLVGQVLHECPQGISGCASSLSLTSGDKRAHSASNAAVSSSSLPSLLSGPGKAFSRSFLATSGQFPVPFCDTSSTSATSHGSRPSAKAAVPWHGSSCGSPIGAPASVSCCRKSSADSSASSQALHSVPAMNSCGKARWAESEIASKPSGTSAPGLQTSTTSRPVQPAARSLETPRCESASCGAAKGPRMKSTAGLPEAIDSAKCCQVARTLSGPSAGGALSLACSINRSTKRTAPSFSSASARALARSSCFNAAPARPSCVKAKPCPMATMACFEVSPASLASLPAAS
mmetsp:Transcript_119803/g.310761  ORF Transcript_119803/g.310761 Transcript_119803/m.310761 type:complete len:307 (+) Transcript_119803:60-980(+)